MNVYIYTCVYIYIYIYIYIFLSLSARLRASARARPICPCRIPRPPAARFVRARPRAQMHSSPVFP